MFKAGDKVRKKDGSKFSNGKTVVTIGKYEWGSPWFVETNTHLAEHYLELVEEKKEMTHKYNEGQWYAWDGKGTCPLHPEDEFTTLGLDGSKNGYHNKNPKLATSYRINEFQKCSWKWNTRQDNELQSGFDIVAFYITKKYKEPETVEMTVEEICKALGKNIKVVK